MGWMPDKNWIVFPPFCNGMPSQCPWPARVCASVCVCIIVCLSICYFQGAASNVIRCRKDGNWTGSFRLCPHSRGQCSLPQNLHYSLQYSCKRGHGIGLYCTNLLSYNSSSVLSQLLLSGLLFSIAPVTHSFSLCFVYSHFLFVINKSEQNDSTAVILVI